MYRLFLSLRYLLRRRTAIGAILAVMFGVATLLTVMSIMEGFIVEVHRMTRDKDAHVAIAAGGSKICDAFALEEALAQVPGVIGTAPSIETLAMYKSDAYFNPCLVRGIDPEQEVRVTAIDRFFFRPEELDEILGHLQIDKPNTSALERLSRRSTAETHARSLGKSRAPMVASEIEELFSLDHRRAIVDPALKDLILKNGRPPSALIAGLPLLLDGILSIGQPVKLITVKPGEDFVNQAALVEGNFIVAGAFKTGSHEIDSSLFFVRNRRLYRPLGMFDPDLGEPCYTEIRVKLDDFERAGEARDEINAVLDRLIGSGSTISTRASARSWENQRPGLVRAVEREKWLVGFIVALLNLFTAMVVFLMLILMLIEKSRDTGVLLAIGATPGGVLTIFFLNGFIVTAVGTVLGLVAGLLFTTNINVVHDWIHAVTGYRLFNPEIYHMDRIPIRTTPIDVVITSTPALGFGFLASLFPAARAARQDPIKAMHDE